jgi:hypothetical protein
MEQEMVEVKLQIGDQQILLGEAPKILADAIIERATLSFEGAEEPLNIEMERLDTKIKDQRVDNILFTNSDRLEVWIGNRVKVILGLKSGGEALETDVMPDDWTPPKRALMRWDRNHETIRTLAMAIEEYDGESWMELTFAERLDKTLALPSPVLDYLSKRWNAYGEEVRGLIESDKIEDTLKKS